LEAQRPESKLSSKKKSVGEKDGEIRFEKQETWDPRVEAQEGIENFPPQQ
jgi:hypothetical protein